jgi:hypothetical protein
VSAPGRLSRVCAKKGSTPHPRYTPRSAAWSASCCTVAATRHWASAIVTARRARAAADVAPAAATARRVWPAACASGVAQQLGWDQAGVAAVCAGQRPLVMVRHNQRQLRHNDAVGASHAHLGACTTRRGRPGRAIDATKCLGALLCLCFRPDGVVPGAAATSPRPGLCKVERALPVSHPGPCSA